MFLKYFNQFYFQMILRNTLVKITVFDINTYETIFLQMIPRNPIVKITAFDINTYETIFGMAACLPLYDADMTLMGIGMLE